MKKELIKTNQMIKADRFPSSASRNARNQLEYPSMSNGINIKDENQTSIQEVDFHFRGVRQN